MKHKLAMFRLKYRERRASGFGLLYSLVVALDWAIRFPKGGWYS